LGHDPLGLLSDSIPLVVLKSDELPLLLEDCSLSGTLCLYLCETIIHLLADRLGQLLGRHLLFFDPLLLCESLVGLSLCFSFTFLPLLFDLLQPCVLLFEPGVQLRLLFLTDAVYLVFTV